MEILEELLTYKCPYSGRKRVAGQYDDEGTEMRQTTKFHSCSVKLSCDVSTYFISFQFTYFMPFIQIYSDLRSAKLAPPPVQLESPRLGDVHSMELYGDYFHRDKMSAFDGVTTPKSRLCSPEVLSPGDTCHGMRH